MASLMTSVASMIPQPDHGQDQSAPLVLQFR